MCNEASWERTYRQETPCMWNMWKEISSSCSVFICVAIMVRNHSAATSVKLLSPPNQHCEVISSIMLMWTHSGVLRTSMQLYNHVRRHTRPFKCDICSKSFSSWDSIRRHVPTHEKNYRCQNCGTLFSGLHKLSKHEKECPCFQN